MNTVAVPGQVSLLHVHDLLAIPSPPTLCAPASLLHVTRQRADLPEGLGFATS